ncbi:MAG: histidine kinase dimerization/phosphoacceptor domain -containing protein [Saprospiraceae bacterium]
MDNKSEMSNSYNNISIIEYNLGNFQDAIKYQLEAIKLNKEINQKASLPMNYVCLSTYYSEVDSMTKAIEFGMDALQQSKEIGSRRALLYSLSCLGDLYLKQKQYDESKKYYFEFIAQIDESVDQFEKNTVISKIGELNYKLKNYNPALDYSLQALGYFKGIGANREIYTIEDIIAKIYFAKNDTRNAYKYKVEADSIKNLVLNEEKDKQIKELTTKYDLKVKEEENNTLKKEKELQAVMINSKNNYLKLFGFLALLLTGLIIALYRNYRNKIKLNNELIAKNVQIETLSRENTHRIKNNLALLSSMMQMQIRRLNSPELKEIVMESENRVRVLTTTEKQLLSNTNDDSKIDFKNYITNIIENIIQFNSGEDFNINSKMSIDEFILDADKSLKLGLIINELITNSIKYADKTSGEIELNLSIKNENGITIEYSDSGSEIASDFNMENSNSLGLKLIRDITQQMHGKYEIDIDGGLKYRFYFGDLIS